MTSNRPSPLRAALLASLVAVSASALGACRADRIVNAEYPTTYDQRHAIVLAEGAHRLDLPAGGGPRGLTDRQRADIRAFAAEWRKTGRGPVGMMIPSGGGDYASPAIKTTLAAAGVPATQIVSSRYRADSAVAPVKLGFVKLKAEVPHPCGLWPEDLGHGADFRGANQNRENWNFGCATQQNLAAQVADPEDLARPRAETPVYAARRETVMEKHRAGDDTTTQYSQDDVEVSEVGGAQ